ncbi:hypothetical protein BCR34DRAFT_616027 [Clohesyomyces aquaticus]|uniref:SH3 domain-containing protein n=1 Tax=Clohesyomyces aquaticus TaxID=1231657 RepID=A0A1Y1ZFP6_9PLEO|nr:hypothetical protein BCR34DRAFT_616027 [Clohesyomyces aquaticus]
MTDTLTKPCTELFKVEAAWEWKPSSHEDLGLYKGDILSVFEKINEHWARGRNIKTDRRGRFPFNYTRPITENSLEGTTDEEENYKALVLHQPPAETTNAALRVTTSSQELQPYTNPAQPASWNSVPQLNQAIYQMLTGALTTQPQTLNPQLQQSTYPANTYASNPLQPQPQIQQWPGPIPNISTGGAPVIIGNNNVFRQYNDNHRSYEDRHRSYEDMHLFYSDSRRSFSHHGDYDYTDQGDRWYGNGQPGRWNGGRQSRYSN